MPAKYKQLCSRCKNKYIPATWKQRYVVCYECMEKDLKGEIKDPKMKRMFKIPEDFYKENLFLRDIKANYLRFGKLSEKQIEAFKKVVKKMKEEKK